MVRELVLESEMIRKLEGLGELGGEGGEAGVGAAVHGHDAGVPTGVAKRLGVAPGDYVAIVAAHQTELGAAGIGRRRRRRRRRLHGRWILRKDFDANREVGGASGRRPFKAS